jgi:hypothetical protein
MGSSREDYKKSYNLQPVVTISLALGLSQQALLACVGPALGSIPSVIARSWKPDRGKLSSSCMHCVMPRGVMSLICILSQFIRVCIIASRFMVHISVSRNFLVLVYKLVGRSDGDPRARRQHGHRPRAPRPR